MLHIIRLSPFKVQLEELRRLVKPSDEVLLIDDGTYFLNANALKSLSYNKAYTMSTHCEARNIAANADITVLDEAQTATLIIQHSTTLTWQ